MSFILDAIAKSEAERKRRDIPGADVLAFPLDGPPPRRKTWPYLLAALLLGVNAVAIYLLVGNGDSAAVTGDANALDGRPAASPNLSPTLARAGLPAPATAGDPAAGSGVDARAGANAPAAEAPSRGGAATPSAAETGSDATPADGSPTAPATTATAAAESLALAGTTAAAPESTAIADPGEEGWLRVEPNSLAREIGAARDTGGGGPESAGNPLFNRVVRPAELPDDVRDALPKVTFSGHLYSSNPKSSLVFVGNGRPVVTGQTIERGLVLHQITPGGVVVEFRGYLIEVGVLQNWTLN